jgi:hypothetical protein
MSDATSPPRPLYLVATDDGAVEGYDTVREVGLAKALEDGARVLLYDASSESLLTDPYPVGPWSPEDDAIGPNDALDPQTLEGLGRGYLAEQLLAARERGLQVRAYLAEGTGAKAIVEAVERFSPDLLVLPKSLDDPSLVDKVRSNTLSDLREQVGIPILLVDRDGSTVTV